MALCKDTATEHTHGTFSLDRSAQISSVFLSPAERFGPVCILRGAHSCLDIVTAIYRISSAAAETEPVWLRIVCVKNSPSLGF